MCSEENDILAQFVSYLGNTVGIPENDTNLGGCEALLGQLEDLVLDLVAGHLHPLGHGAPVRQCRLGNTLAWCVHAAHFFGGVFDF